MIDLQLDNAGDIQIESTVFHKSFNVSVCISDTSVQKIRFFSDFETKELGEKHQQQIRFYFNNDRNDAEQGKTAHSSGEELQAIRLRLETEMGDLLYNTSFGSNLWKLRHSIITDKENQYQITSLIKDVVNEIMPEAKVKVEINKGIGYFSMGTVAITIINEEDEEIGTFTF